MLQINVYLNGEPVTHVIEFDTRDGTLTRYQTDEKGQVVMDYQRGEVKRETLTGTVHAAACVHGAPQENGGTR